MKPVSRKMIENVNGTEAWDVCRITLVGYDFDGTGELSSFYKVECFSNRQWHQEEEFETLEEAREFAKAWLAGDDATLAA